jgi:ribosomal protein S18 acetylase RimI-like enzyme
MLMILLPVGTFQDKGGTTYLVRKQYVEGWYVYYAYDAKGHKIAWVQLEPNQESVQEVHVDESLHRRGIATALYDLIERDIGQKLKPNQDLSPFGKAFWASRKSTDHNLTS